MMLYHEIAPTRASIGVLLLRVIVGLAFVVHGWPKIHNPGSWMTMTMGAHVFAPPWLQAIVAIVEVFGGIALIVGFLTPLVALGILVDMAVAIIAVELPKGAHWIGEQTSFEVPLFYLVAMLTFLLTGPGRFSVDAMLARRSISAGSGSASRTRSAQT